MKSVLISIRPKWCELIASGKKKIEVRKTRPKIDTPFKCYIYQTKTGYVSRSKENDGLIPVKYNTGKVIGEFVCENINEFYEWQLFPRGKFQEVEQEELNLFLKLSCLSHEEICTYREKLPYCKPLYGWHISDLVIYDVPKELSEFRTMCKYRNDDGSCQYQKVECNCVKFDFNPDYSLNLAQCLDYMSRPPQSWCYVEELK